MAPDAVKLAVCPAQIVGELTVKASEAATVTVETAVPVHPELVPVTVYVAVLAGDAVAVEAPVDVAPALQV